MLTPENTSQRDPMLHLAGSWDDPSRYITAVESAGQQQLVTSDVLPRDCRGEYADVGIAVVGPVATDDLFVEVRLPDGWSKQASDHSMWSYVIDQHGRKRVQVFYKAAFYDRKAHASILSVQNYVGGCVEENLPVVVDAEWATAPAVVKAATALAECTYYEDGQREMFRAIATEHTDAAAERCATQPSTQTDSREPTP